MKYYIIAGETSGDFHASGLMSALKRYDSRARFRFIGGDMMSKQSDGCVKHYCEIAYMGFIPVFIHLPVILKSMSDCKSDIKRWNPDVLILIDYPGFNLAIAKYVRTHTKIPIYYYISPKIWAWREGRIKSIRKNVDELFSILPFEVPFYEEKHHFKIHYVGNPTVKEVADFLKGETNRGKGGKPIIALLAGSRKQEIKDNLPEMIKAVMPFADQYRIVLAGAPAISRDYYKKFIENVPVEVFFDKTFHLLSIATAAVITSGTATLEASLFNVPQVVCYETPLPKIASLIRKRMIKVPFISLVNLIADKEVVPELVADTFSAHNIRQNLLKILPGGALRDIMLDGYRIVRERLGEENASDNAAKTMVELLCSNKDL